MARYTASCRTTAGTTARPSISLYNSASVAGSIVEIGIVNTTATACTYKIARLPTTGTQGTALTEGLFDPDSAAPSCTAFNTHSADVTGTILDCGPVATLGAAVGSAFIWTFGDTGLRIGLADAVTAVTDGIGVLLSTGTGQALDAYIVWDE